MRDPLTVAFVISYPWYNRGYREPAITVWHLDPESDGTDDSCDWFGNKLTPREVECINGIIKIYITSLFKDCGGNKFTMKYDRLDTSIRISTHMLLHVWRKKFNINHLLVVTSTTCYIDSNSCTKDEYAPEEIKELFYCIGKELKRAMRPWWKHPRLHFWHYSIQVHALDIFKRWVFSRCFKCGKGFSWGYCPVSTGFGGSGPMWFRSERGIAHEHCLYWAETAIKNADRTTVESKNEIN